MPKNIDWAPIRRTYIEAPAGCQPSFEELARQYGISRSSVDKKSVHEEWIARREQYLAKLDNRIREERSTLLVGQQAKFDGDVLEIARAAAQQIKLHFALAQQNLRDENGKIRPLHEKTIVCLVKALAEVQKIGKIALGEASELNPEIQAKLDWKMQAAEYEMMHETELLKLYNERVGVGK